MASRFSMKRDRHRCSLRDQAQPHAIVHAIDRGQGNVLMQGA